ncbi:MAG TPA: hypothetical protein VLL52_12395, partial [Anaerolineae bacterium]|nr:hypothetical protein [Anaerolineae bacterium]
MIMKYPYTIYRFLIFALLLFALALLNTTTVAGQTAVATNPYANQAQTILAQMSSAERVGQLFLITAPNYTLTPDSDLYQLITTYHVGGLMLQQDKGNFPPPPTATLTLGQFISDLQTVALHGSQPITNTITQPLDEPLAANTPPATPIPLFIATNNWNKTTPSGFTP